MPIKDIKHRIYNNKARQGEYIEIITEYNGKTNRHIYKWNPSVPYDIYVAMAQGKYKNKKQFDKDFTQAMKGQTPKRLKDSWTGFKRDQLKKELKRMKSKKSTTKIHTWEEATKNPDKIYEEIFSPLVMNKDILKFVIKNRDKLKHRITITALVNTLNEKQKPVNETFGFKKTGYTIEDMQREYGEKLNKGEIVTLSDYNELHNKGKLTILGHHGVKTSGEKHKITFTKIKVEFG